MKYKSAIYEAAHQDATEMFKISAMSEAEMREFDEMRLLLCPSGRSEQSPVAFH